MLRAEDQFGRACPTVSNQYCLERAQRSAMQDPIQAPPELQDRWEYTPADRAARICWVSAADKRCRVYPFDLRPDAVYDVEDEPEPNPKYVLNMNGFTYKGEIVNVPKSAFIRYDFDNPIKKPSKIGFCAIKPYIHSLTRPDAVVQCSGCTPGKRHALYLPDDQHTAFLVGLRGGWMHARTKMITRIYGSNAAVPG
ncbi:hypothetical protein TNCV_2916741 [Trichonephila clavipes]|nr:hypothetical protein TNCV_2916741 [Trichonephila clavipes]